MGADPKILDDIARVAGGAVNIVSGLQTQIRDEIKSRIEDMADRMDLVPREDLERLEVTVSKLRKEQADLEKRLAALEGKSKSAPKTKSTKAPAKKKATTKKPAAKKTSAKKSVKKAVKKTASKKKKS